MAKTEHSFICQSRRCHFSALISGHRFGAGIDVGAYWFSVSVGFYLLPMVENTWWAFRIHMFDIDLFKAWNNFQAWLRINLLGFHFSIRWCRKAEDNEPKITYYRRGPLILTATPRK